jgi:hypothetical protein
MLTHKMAAPIRFVHPASAESYATALMRFSLWSEVAQKLL